MMVGVDVCQVWGEGGGQTNVTRRSRARVIESPWFRVGLVGGGEEVGGGRWVELLFTEAIGWGAYHW